MGSFDTVAPEQTGFELERFQWSGTDRLEVEGRWFGVRGRRFVRPVLTVQVRGRRRRLLALLEHKPWTAGEGEVWIAAFPWDGPQEEVGDGELEVGSLTVDLPPPGGRRFRKRAVDVTPVETADEAGGPAAAADTAGPSATVEASAAAESRTPPPLAPDDPLRRSAVETRGSLERDLAGARAELGRIRTRHEEEMRSLRSEAASASERVQAARDEAAGASAAAEAARSEAERLRAELEHERAAQAAGLEEVERLREAAAADEAERRRLREEVESAAAEADRLRAAAADSERLRTSAARATAELERLREDAREAAAENERLRQAARKASAEAERLRSASARRTPPAPARSDGPDPQATVAFDALAAAHGESPPEPARPAEPARHAEPARPAERTEPRAPSGPPPTVRRIPRGGAPVEPPPERTPRAPGARLLGEVPQKQPSLQLWGPRVFALTLVVLLLAALLLAVAGVL